ncbi:ATP-binding cassette domain-containing protein [bacterium]|nr:ATP-binding cassette domain-containing protein [bacterium]
MNNLLKFISDNRAAKWTTATIFLLAFSISFFELILMISFVNLSNTLASTDTPENLRSLINYYQRIFPELNSKPKSQAILSFLLVFFGITVLKIFRAYITSVGVSKLGALITEKYLRLLLDTNLMKNSQEISFAQSNLTRVQSIVFAFLVPLCNVMSSAVVILVLLISSLYVNAFVPFTSLIISAVIATFLQSIIQRKISRLSNQINILLPRRLKNIESVHASYHPRKLFKSEEINIGYLKKFQSTERNYFLNLGIVNFLVILPRPILELAFLLIFALLTFISFTADHIDGLLLLSYLILTLRILPYVNEFYFNLNKAKSTYPQFTTYVLTENKYSQIKLNGGNDVAQSRHTGRKPTHIFARKIDNSHSVEVNLETSQWIMITGKSGSGKSSLVDALIYGKNSQWDCSCPLIESDYIISYVPQSVKTIVGTYMQNMVGHYQEPQPGIDFLALVELLELDHIFTKDNLIDDFSDKSGQLSGGELKRIGLLRAIHSEPDILFVDESFGSISSEQEHRILTKLDKMLPRCKMILISHRSIDFFRFTQNVKLS